MEQPQDSDLEAVLQSFDRVVDLILKEQKLLKNKKDFTIFDRVIRIRDRLMCVQKPLSPIEYTDLIELSHTLNNEPEDIGLFQDLYQQCSEILRYRGFSHETHREVPKNASFYMHTSFSSRLELLYKERYPGDFLFITYSADEQPNRTLVMARFRGYQNVKPENLSSWVNGHDSDQLSQEIRMQETEAIMRGELGYPDLNENPTNFLAPQPRSIIFHDGREYKLHKY